MKRLDQYYTFPLVAGNCISYLKNVLHANFFNFNAYTFIEPSAGDGAFYDLLPPDRRIGIDIEPKAEGIFRSDFLRCDISCPRRVIVLGNPPFGKNSSMAVKFFNHASRLSAVDFIAFIVPKTFRKVSIQNRLSMDFHLVGEMNLPAKSFIKDGKPYAVPCCFQIWQRKEKKREPVKFDLENEWFEFVKKSEKPDLAVRRVGWTSGHCTKDIADCKEQSFYFLKLKKGVNATMFRDNINNLSYYGHFTNLIMNTAGARSLSKGEFVSVLQKNSIFI